MSSHTTCSRRERRFPFYPVLLYVGLVTALVVADRLARRSGADARRIVIAFLALVPVCLAGARALEVALGWRYYRARPREVLSLARGGAAMYGALPPALLCSIPLASWTGLPLGRFWDIAFVAILCGMIPTRLGCLGAGCCAGRATAGRLGLVLRNVHGVRERRYPVPLLEALLGAVLLVAALVAWDSAPFAGAVALGVTASYGAGRYALDGLREEPGPRLLGLGAYRWMSAALVLVGVVGLSVGFARSPDAPALAAAREEAGALHLALSALLLLPVVRLFRFLGCHLVFQLDELDTVTHSLQMLVIVPDLGTGPASASMSFELEPDMQEVDGSPFELEPAGTEPDGRLRFEKLAELPEGAYTVLCNVSRADAITRTGTCSGELNGPGLVVAFNAENGSAPNVLQPRLCFQTL